MTHRLNINMRQRLTALSAAALMNLLVAGSQLALSHHYTTEADALLAAQRAQTPVAATAQPTGKVRS